MAFVTRSEEVALTSEQVRAETLKQTLAAMLPDHLSIEVDHPGHLIRASIADQNGNPPEAELLLMSDGSTLLTAPGSKSTPKFHYAFLDGVLDAITALRIRYDDPE
ncbi:hypothetical protein ACFWEJ_00950 [Promicromonospora sp. NPDC060204]|uniref:hypothetical protein n=1 Tax=Promicromonospora sp. NPDC060204 TaxID=3347071 RepID=UPI00366306A2